MKKSLPTVRKVGWIIRNIKRGSIWKQTYSSKEEASAELTSQIRMVKKTHPTFTGSDWKLEPFEYFGAEDGLEDFGDK